jgi:ankyrin repeat protein
MDLDPARLAGIVLTAFEAAGVPWPLVLRHRPTVHYLYTLLHETRDSLELQPAVTKPPPELPLEILLMIAHHMRDDDGELRYDDFNSFLQVNRTLYTCLNRTLWKEAAEHAVGAERVFTQLIKTNDLAYLKFFLDLGAKAEVRLPAFEITGLLGERYDRYSDDTEPTPLIVAADTDNFPMARLLLERGAKVNYADKYGSKFSPLHAARSAEMVQLLLDHNADPDWDDDLACRPLHWYAKRNNMAAMRAILRHGAEVNPDTAYEKPLHEAARRSLAAVKLLVEHGADVEERDLAFNTPLHLAAQEGKTAVARFLVELWPEGTRATNERQQTPLHLAAQADLRDAGLMRVLVEQWPEGMREGERWLNTPLHLAAYQGQGTEVVRLLVEGWPEAVRKKNALGNTPLHLAAGVRSRNTDVIRFLAELWPEAKGVLNEDGETPLLRFEKYAKPNLPGVSDEEKDEIIALLGGPQSEANDD